MKLKLSVRFKIFLSVIYVSIANVTKCDHYAQNKDSDQVSHDTIEQVMLFISAGKEIVLYC